MRTTKDSETLKGFPKLQTIVETGVVFLMSTENKGMVVFDGDSEFFTGEITSDDIDNTNLVDYNGTITLSNH